MDDSKALAYVPRSELAKASRDALDRVFSAASDPNVDIEKLERLMALGERMVAEQRKAAFAEAKAWLFAHVRPVKKGAQAHTSKYATLEDIDDMTRPLMIEAGMSFSFTSETKDGKNYLFSCTMQHRDGWSETNHLLLPIDTGPGRNAVQAVASTSSYARRYLVKLHLNIIETNEDDDGNLGRGAHGYVTAEQASGLREALANVNGDEDKFMRYAFRLGPQDALTDDHTWERIPAREYDRVNKAISEKGRR